ncbi:MAG: hypothetical protein NVSMB10_12720 [Steroidobacteraceae bacterium]
MQVLAGAALAASFMLVGCNKPLPAAADPPSAASAADAKTGAKAKPAAGGAKEEGAAKEEGGKEAEAKGEAGEGVTLTPEQIEKLGLVTETAKATEYTEEVAGYGVVVAHETIATAAAELVTAQATEKLSKSALARAKRLSGTAGAMSADVEETASHQAAVDAAALTLTNQRLSSTLGMKPPWKSADSSGILQQLASGKIKLVRVTFPLGTLSGTTPARLRAARIGTVSAD